MFLGVDFFALDSWCLLPNLESFRHYLFEYRFNPILLILYLWESNDRNVRSIKKCQMLSLLSFCDKLFLHCVWPLTIDNPYNTYFRLLNLVPAYFPQDKRETFSARFKELWELTKSNRCKPNVYYNFIAEIWNLICSKISQRRQIANISRDKYIFYFFLHSVKSMAWYFS